MAAPANDVAVDGSDVQFVARYFKGAAATQRPLEILTTVEMQNVPQVD